MILPLRVLGSSGVSRIWRGLAMGPISRATWSRNSATSCFPASPSTSLAPLRVTKATMAWPGGGVVGAHHGGLGHGRMADQGVLHLGGREPVSRDVHDVVHPPEQPQVAVLVALGAVAGEVAPGEALPVRLDEALVVAVDAPGHARPRLGDHEVAALAVAHRVAVVVDHVGGDAGERRHGGTRLGGGDPGQRRDHDAAGLGLPPGVDDGAAIATDVGAVPDPRLGVDRLPHRTEEPQAREVVLRRQVLAPLHERPDGRGRGVEDVDLVLLDDLPPAVARRACRACLRT